jgi:hypothetical protein
MTSVPHGEDTDWDRIKLGEDFLPGVWRCEGSLGRNMDVKATKGKDGAVIKDEGYENAKITLTGQFVSRDDLRALEVALKAVHPRRKGATRDPLPINHPALTAIGVTAVYITSIAVPQLYNGIYEVAIETIEYLKPTDRKKRKMAIAPPLSVSLGDVSRQMRGAAYGGPSGIEHVHTGYEPPSMDTQWAALLAD